MAAPFKEDIVFFDETSDGKASLMKTKNGSQIGMRLSFGRKHTPIRARPKLGRPLEGMHPDYPYENIVLQGGGAKGIIYGGAVIALDELGILPYVKRVAAASAGCAPALMVSLGLDSTQVAAETNKINMHEFFDGAKNIPYPLKFLQKFYLGWRVFAKLGMHPADVALEYFGNMLEKYTGNADLTFLDLYHFSGRELCIAVSNVSRAQAEFCHVNTTPDMPIRRAIRASMSLPIMWEPIELFPGEKYVDGGLFCNFPLKAFDGWFLSTKEDGLLVRAQEKNQLNRNMGTHDVIKAYKESMSSSFAEPNMATIGFRVADDASPDEAAYATYLDSLEKRLKQARRSRLSMSVIKKLMKKVPDVKFPDTPKAKAYLEKKEAAEFFLEGTHKYEEAYVELKRWMLINAHEWPETKLHPVGTDKKAFAASLALKPPNFSYHIFGYESWDEFVDAIDYGNKGYLTRNDAGRFWDKFNVRHPFMKNRKPKSIESIKGLSGELLNSMYSVAEETLLRDPNNAKRICLLSTKYVGLLDLDIEVEDKQFLYEVGRRETLAWIQTKTMHHDDDDDNDSEMDGSTFYNTVLAAQAHQ